MIALTDFTQFEQRNEFVLLYIIAPIMAALTVFCGLYLTCPPIRTFWNNFDCPPDSSDRQKCFANFDHVGLAKGRKEREIHITIQQVPPGNSDGADWWKNDHGDN